VKQGEIFGFLDPNGGWQDDHHPMHAGHDPTGKVGNAFGWEAVLPGIPLLTLAVSNAAGGCPWWTFTLPGILVFYDGVEFVVDYLLKFDFRRSRWLGPYLAIYYLALMGDRLTLCSGKNLRFCHPACIFH
jgi:hypothetical protein